MEVNEIINILKNPKEGDSELIKHAFEFASEMHKGQKRFSGEEYIVHPFETAKILAHLQMDGSTIAAGFLHDICEDCLVTGTQTNVTPNYIAKEFGEEIAFLVDGVTKLGKLKYHGEERRTENLRKMILAMAKDIRVVIIKLADRLHNVRTLEHVREEKRRRIAMETLEIYCPIANRLGIEEIKIWLEDAVFPIAYPEEYKNTKELATEKYKEKEAQLSAMKEKIEVEMNHADMKDYRIKWRVKTLYSLWKKLMRPDINMDINLVYDLSAMRVIVNTIEECYRVLGIIHHLWTPMPGRIKDYIAMPKPNGYQSLHTTVFTKDGHPAEIQIRTQKMHIEADHGIAAHWAYTEGGKPKQGIFVRPEMTWINQLAEWQQSVSESQDFLENLRIDFFNDRVFCFTPKGGVVDLPEGATIIDFAYAVHSDLGNQAMGAKVNGKFVAVNTSLKNADIVEIQIQKNKKPNQDWLGFVKTSLARRQIRTALAK